jgi:thioredoxin reductase (NADPH)
MEAREVDCVVIGGGPGGLTAATYLGRFHRSVVVIDAGASRLQLIPMARNVPGFPEGVSGPELHARMREQAKVYGADLIEGEVTSCERHATGFVVSASAGQFRARAVVLATGVEVTAPGMTNLEVAIARGLIRYCPVCDGYEATNRRIGVLGRRPGAIAEAHFLRTFSSDVTFIPMAGGPELTAEQLSQAQRTGIAVEARACTGLDMLENAIAVRHASGDASVFDVIYPCLGSRPRSELARMLGADASGEGEIVTDTHLATNIVGLYAVGDVLRGLDQVASACGQAAIAATAIHNRLREQDERGALADAPSS